MRSPIINGKRLLQRLQELGQIGGLPSGGGTRLALSDEDKLGRDLIATWLSEAGATVHVDKIGNIYGVVGGSVASAPIMTGSHIDTVVRAGLLDGCYGVVAGVELLQAINEAGLQPTKPLAVVVFSNEEGVRFSPDLLGSRVIAKDIALDEALAVSTRDGKTFQGELTRIGYAGEIDPWKFLPEAFLELHIEQGPILEATQTRVGIVEALQGHSWWQVEIEGCANHAGTTPMNLRKDAGVAAMQLACRIEELSAHERLPNVATIGTFTLEPNAINVVPGRAKFTIDFRDADDNQLQKADAWLWNETAKLQDLGYEVKLQRLSKALSIQFDAKLCDLLEETTQLIGASHMRMVSGASHDAQMIAKVCPSAMVFVQSCKGISHNPKESTPDEELVLGAQILTNAMWTLATSK
ncbi:Zn-dependent hydrolase [Pseudomonas taiwanensis]|uniref:Zn-dependent hydrolase n=1 Tax=Pseudomonas taiwanensis TaxID=470150 RepID=UPI00040F4474|nr:Zn-dependent hydrolase [Pseudomonas taiwanensis]